MRVKTGVEIKSGLKSFKKIGNGFYALYLNGGRIGQAFDLKGAKDYLK